MINVYLAKGVVNCNNVNSFINVLLHVTAFDDILPCHIILHPELNKIFDDIS